MTAELSEYAESFATEAQEHGHDLNKLDVLDILASCGLALVTGFENEASETYMNEIKNLGREQT